MAAILLLVMTLTGCNESMTNENQNRTEITFSWWGNDDRHAYTMDGIDIFCANNPVVSDVSHNTLINTKVFIKLVVL